MTKPRGTRTRIMEISRHAVLEKGCDATSIEEIVAAAEITKSGFFYHFSDKNVLARAMLEQYIQEEDDLFDGLFDRAAELTDDPLQRVLIGLQVLAEAYDDMEAGHPGCLIAAAAYQDRLFDTTVRNLYRDAMLSWRARFRGDLDNIVAEYAPRLDVNLDDLADIFCTTAEAGIVMSRAIGQRHIAPAQIRLLRNRIRLLFSPIPERVNLEREIMARLERDGGARHAAGQCRGSEPSRHDARHGGRRHVSNVRTLLARIDA